MLCFDGSHFHSLHTIRFGLLHSFQDFNHSIVGRNFISCGKKSLFQCIFFWIPRSVDARYFSSCIHWFIKCIFSSCGIANWKKKQSIHPQKKMRIVRSSNAAATIHFVSIVCKLKNKVEILIVCALVWVYVDGEDFFQLSFHTFLSLLSIYGLQNQVKIGQVKISNMEEKLRTENSYFQSVCELNNTFEMDVVFVFCNDNKEKWNRLKCKKLIFLTASTSTVKMTIIESLIN